MKKYLQFSLIIQLFVVTFAFGQNYYLGVYNTDISTSCSSCHLNIVTAWEGTGHASAHPAPSAFYGYSCLPCHNTGWDTLTVNRGADEYVSNPSGNTYVIAPADSANFILKSQVQCEACHGAVGTAGGTVDPQHFNRVTDFSADNCGVCHQDSHHPYLEEWETSGHAASITGHSFEDRSRRYSCYRCHAGNDFLAYTYDRENYVDTLDTHIEGGQANLQPITCVVCHDPHGNENPGNLRIFEPGKVVCDACHSIRTANPDSVDIYLQRPHNTTAEALSGSPMFGYQYPGETYPNSPHTDLATERCINCHVVRLGPGEFGSPVGHTFEAKVEACAIPECHGSSYYNNVDTSDVTKRFDYRGAQTTTRKLLTLLGDILRPYNAQIYPDTNLSVEYNRAAYNYRTVNSEQSFGIHNTKLAQKLLIDAIANFLPTDVEIDITGDVPTAFKLEQNFPNPFNPTTTIKFALPEAGNVRLVVYDILGKEVDVLVNEYLPATNYTVKWNAAKYASGIYIYRLQSGNFSMVKKMLLIK